MKKVLEIDLINENTHCKCNYFDMDKIIITPEGIVISGADTPLNPVDRNFHTFEKWDGLTEVRLRVVVVVEDMDEVYEDPCQFCAYNDEGSCSCFDRKSIECPKVMKEGN